LAILLIVLIVFSSLSVSLPRVSATEVELYYDDGEMDWSESILGSKNGYAVKFTPPATPWILKKIRVYGSYEPSDASNGIFYIKVWDINLVTLLEVEYLYGDYFNYRLSGGYTWATIDIPDTMIDGDFYVVFFPNSIKDTQYLWMGQDFDPPISGRSYSASTAYGNYIYNQQNDREWMIRAVGDEPSIRVWFRCKNKATGSRSDASDVAVYIDGTYRGTTDSNGNLIIDIKPGTYTVQFEGDGYPSQSASITVPSDTDIYVVDVTLTGQLKVDPIEPYDGQTYESVEYFSAEVTFRGTPIGDANVKFYLDGNLVGSVLSDSNGKAELLKYVSEGTHSWYVTAEKVNWIAGTSPIWYFTVGKPQLDGEISGYMVLTPEVEQGSELKVEVTVKNTGDISAEYNVYIGIIYDSEGNIVDNAYSESHQIIELDAGVSQTLVLVWTTPSTMQPGDYSGDLNLKIAEPGGVWEKHKEYPHAISFSVTGVMPGYIQMTVTNDDDDSQSIDIYIDGEWRLRKLGILPGENYEYTFEVKGDSYHTIEMRWHDDDTALDYSKDTQVYVDSGQTVQVYFTIDLHLPTQQLPDLTVTKIELSPWREGNIYDVGETITIYLTIKNEGNDDAIDFQVDWYVDGSLLHSWPGWSLKAGESTSSLGVQWTVTEGDHVIEVVVDPNDKIDELDETDNKGSTTVTGAALQDKPDLVILDIFWEPSDPTVGDSVIFSYIIKNQGTREPPTSQLHYTLMAKELTYQLGHRWQRVKLRLTLLLMLGLQSKGLMK
jgi:hypothetical protein